MMKKMTRIIWNKLVLFLLLGLNSIYCFAQDRTNILLIFIDDMGYGDLGCYGNEEVQTPNIDRLAQEGIRFNQFYVNSPICSPSRVAITTGQYLDLQQKSGH